MYLNLLSIFNGSSPGNVSTGGIPWGTDCGGYTSCEVTSTPPVQIEVTSSSDSAEWTPTLGESFKHSSRGSATILDAIIDAMNLEYEPNTVMDGGDISEYVNIYGSTTIDIWEYTLPRGQIVPDLYTLRKKVRESVREYLEDVPAIRNSTFCWTASVKDIPHPTGEGYGYKIYIGFSHLPR